jgi:hypothetical protein
MDFERHLIIQQSKILIERDMMSLRLNYPLTTGMPL